MEFKVYTNKKKPVFLYIHGEYLSTFSFRIQIKELKKEDKFFMNHYEEFEFLLDWLKER